jgi:hypothetical protein
MIVAIIPLVISKIKFGEFEAWKASNGNSSAFMGRWWQPGFLIERGKIDECMRLALEYLFERKRCYSVELCGIPPGSDAFEVLCRVRNGIGPVAPFVALSKGSYLPLESTWDAL